MVAGAGPRHGGFAVSSTIVSTTRFAVSIMTVRTVLKMGDPRLLQRSEPVESVPVSGFGDLVEPLFGLASGRKDPKKSQ